MFIIVQALSCSFYPTLFSISSSGTCIFYRMFTLYAKSLPLDVASRVWDLFSRDGEEFLFRTALGTHAFTAAVSVQYLMLSVHVYWYCTACFGEPTSTYVCKVLTKDASKVALNYCANDQTGIFAAVFCFLAFLYRTVTCLQAS